MTLEEFNQLAELSAVEQLYGCCHCKTWAEKMAALRPFESLDQLLRAANDLWRGADEDEILEAFSGHARIGDIELLRSRYAGRATREQGQVMNASEDVLQELHALNVEYEQRYGFIFIVCATGKSAEEMLLLLKARINNGRAIELINGAREQGAITRLRLQQLLQ
jgi:2-oxo-4-hydroxy-4-carboxy-5-ureidoimidazoline decarboxylase